MLNVKVMGKASKKKRTAKLGYCNICNQYRELTFDHVPPKGSIELKPVEMKYLIDRLSEVAKHPIRYIYADDTLKYQKPQVQLSQNGIKFRTICANCNNVLLGKRYDPEIKRISTEVGKIVRARFETGLILPSVITVPVRTHSLMRGIIGHLLAATKSKDQTKPLPGFEDGFYRNLRDYFLNEDLPLPPGIEIYYWPYPFREQVIVNSLGVGLTKSGLFVVGDLIKFFPLAYYVAEKEISTLELAVPKIIGDGCNDENCSISLQIGLDTVPPINWPEFPDASHYTMMPYELSVFAKSRERGRAV